MKELLKPNLVNQRHSPHLGINDIMHTRITGQHQYWPQDADTTRRLKRLNEPVPVVSRRMPDWVTLLAITLVIGGAWGLVLLWASL